MYRTKADTWKWMQKRAEHCQLLDSEERGRLWDIKFRSRIEEATKKYNQHVSKVECMVEEWLRCDAGKIARDLLRETGERIVVVSGYDQAKSDLVFYTFGPEGFLARSNSSEYAPTPQELARAIVQQLHLERDRYSRLNDISDFLHYECARICRGFPQTISKTPAPS